jgi:biopolymer transport protein ExbD
MSEAKNNYDVWFLASNTVFKEVPYEVVTDWVQQSRLGTEDMLKSSGTDNWFKLANLPHFTAYLSKPEPQKVGDAAEALEPIEMDFSWKRRHEDEDDDVDMIPLIDISLVLLIFFMMTTTISAISRVLVPGAANALGIDANKNTLCIYIEAKGSTPYSIGRGTGAPEPEDDKLPDEASMLARLDALLQAADEPQEVRVAAHGDLPYSTVESVMKQLDRRRGNEKGQLFLYSIEVNEKVKRKASWKDNGSRPTRFAAPTMPVGSRWKRIRNSPRRWKFSIRRSRRRTPTKPSST